MHPTPNTPEQKNRRGDDGPTRRNTISMVLRIAHDLVRFKAKSAIPHTFGDDGDDPLRLFS
jgi:hypothetical protein